MSGSAAMPDAEALRGPGSVIQLLGPDDLRRIVDRMAHQIIEDVAQVRRSTPCCSASRPAACRSPSGWPRGSRRSPASTLPVGSLDITLYRDDLRLRGVRPLGETVEPRRRGRAAAP